MITCSQTTMYQEHGHLCQVDSKGGAPVCLQYQDKILKQGKNCKLQQFSKAQPRPVEDMGFFFSFVHAAFVIDIMSVATKALNS